MSDTTGALATAERRVWDEVGVVPSERMVTLPRLGVSVRLQEVGTGPPAVFLHGTSVGGTTWAGLAGALPDVRCLLVDRPGCGGSEALPGPVDLPRLLVSADSLVVDLLDALDLGSAAIVATSRGALDALRGAAAHHDRIDRVLLFGWGMGAPGSRAPLWVRAGAAPGAAWMTGRVPVGRRAVRALLRRFGMRRAISEGGMSPAMLDWLVEVYRHTDTLANEARSGTVLLDLRHGWADGLELDADVLGRVRAPTRVVWGTDDPFGDADVAHRLVSALPDAQLDLVADAGHAPWLDEPAHCAEIAHDVLVGGPAG